MAINAFRKHIFQWRGMRSQVHMFECFVSEHEARNFVRAKAQHNACVFAWPDKLFN